MVTKRECGQERPMLMCILRYVSILKIKEWAIEEREREKKVMDERISRIDERMTFRKRQTTFTETITND